MIYMYIQCQRCQRCPRDWIFGNGDFLFLARTKDLRGWESGIREPKKIPSKKSPNPRMGIWDF